MQQDTGIAAVAHVIQLVIAPVFLVSGIGAMLGVMTNRLSRVVDRARALERDLASSPERPSLAVAELDTLARRARLISHSITLCTTTALLTCAVIAILFLDSFLNIIDASKMVALLFVAAMLAFFIGLWMFLREILLATATLRIGSERAPAAPTPSQKGPDRYTRTTRLTSH
jgi:hypothetical protein